MAGLPVPDYGGAWVPDSGGGSEIGSPPSELLDILGKFGQKGVIISGVVTWIAAQIDTQVNDGWKSLAERCLLDEEVTAAKDTLKNARGQVLENLVPEFKIKRSGDGKKSKEIEDIRKALIALQGAGEMPLVLASSSQMVRCPQSWGVPATATVQDLMGKVIMLEQIVTNNMESQKEQMDQLKQEFLASRKAEPRTPVVPDIRVLGDTPSKKRKLADSQPQEESSEVRAAPSYASMAGVHPLLKNSLRHVEQQSQHQSSPRSQRNILFGSAKSTGTGAASKETMLAADVSLVASGVGKGCTPDNLSDFLAGKGINPVEVVMLTKQEVISEVRTLTFRVTVKPEQYEAALKPEVWPYRVAVRHYRQPRRERVEGSWQRQSEQSGGQVHRDQGQGGTGRPHHSGGGPHSTVNGKFLPPGHASQGGQNQQIMENIHPSPIELRNLYSVLSRLGGDLGQQALH